MKNNKRISELLVETKAYTDLPSPVILTSGELGIYYVNTEKLCQDNGQFNQYGGSSKEMIAHAVRMMDAHPSFREVVEIVAEKAESFLNAALGVSAISGGQRRDWLFSGPVAQLLNLPHISVYKQEEGKDFAELVYGSEAYSDVSFQRYKSVHIVDLITEGSSVYRIENGVELGWLPMLKSRDAELKSLIAVVTRLQGGEKMLAEQGVRVHPFVAIDEDFLRSHSANPERAVAYAKDPAAWSENYLENNGALSFMSYFGSESGKQSRARRFLERYSNVLEESGRLAELECAVSKAYGKSLSELVF